MNNINFICVNYMTSWQGCVEDRIQLFLLSSSSYLFISGNSTKQWEGEKVYNNGTVQVLNHLQLGGLAIV